MTLDQTAQIAAILSVSVPLCALAWSAAAYVRLRQSEIRRERYERFFEVMEHIGSKGGSIASKVAAVFELRRFPEYQEVIIRLFERVGVEGDAAPMLKSEMDLTADFLRKRTKL
ncbi:MAG: hypothetical protein ACLPID_21420 [Beijerinckiaceae bacterium]